MMRFLVAVILLLSFYVHASVSSTNEETSKQSSKTELRLVYKSDDLEIFRSGLFLSLETKKTRNASQKTEIKFDAKLYDLDVAMVPQNNNGDVYAVMKKPDVKIKTVNGETQEEKRVQFEFVKIAENQIDRQNLCTYEDRNKYVTGIRAVVSPKGKFVAVHGTGGESLLLAKTAASPAIKTFQASQSVAFNEDETLLASLSKNKVTIFAGLSDKPTAVKLIPAPKKFKIKHVVFFDRRLLVSNGKKIWSYEASSDLDFKVHDSFKAVGKPLVLDDQLILASKKSIRVYNRTGVLIGKIVPSKKVSDAQFSHVVTGDRIAFRYTYKDKNKQSQDYVLVVSWADHTVDRIIVAEEISALRVSGGFVTLQMTNHRAGRYSLK